MEIRQVVLNTIKYDAEAKGLNESTILEWWNKYMERLDRQEERKAARKAAAEKRAKKKEKEKSQTLRWFGVI